MVALERRAESCASTVKKDALIGLRQLENVTYLLGAPAFEVAQGYDRALGRREGRKLALDVRTRLLAEHELLRSFLPSQWRHAPEAGRDESLRLDQLFVFGRQRSEAKTVRRSRAPRVFARFTRMRPIHVLKVERPSN